MAKNEFLPFAIAKEANVLSEDDYQKLPARSDGFHAGVAKSDELNKVWRQASVIAHVVAEFIAEGNEADVKDDGDMESLKSALSVALKKSALDAIGNRNVSDIYPIGIVVWFAQNKNPNELFPGMVWKYLGEDKNIRLAKADGGDVMSTGGADTIVLNANNLPSHQHSFTTNTDDYDYGNIMTSAFNYGTVTTDETGGHVHSGVPGRTNPWSIGGKTGQKFNFSESGNTDSAGAHTHKINLGNHSHNVAVGSHHHTVSGVTEKTGSSSNVSVLNSFLKLMAWYRVS